jgi:hypothetical protein
VSLYDKTPDKPHAGSHITYNENDETFTLSTHGEGEKATKQTGNCFLTTACMNYYQ